MKDSGRGSEKLCGLLLLKVCTYNNMISIRIAERVGKGFAIDFRPVGGTAGSVDLRKATGVALRSFPGA